MRKIGLYLRVSTTEQSRLTEGSLASQRHRLETYVAYRNTADSDWGKIVGTYVDEAQSGGHIKRPRLIKLIRKIRCREIDTVIVTDLSRLSRSIQDFSALWELMRASSTKLISLREHFDTDSAAGEMMLFALINFAQFERKQTAERVSANFRARAERGLFNGGPVPIGFDIDPAQRGYLRINPDEATQVRLIFYFFRSTGTIRSTLQRVREAGILPKARSKSRTGVGIREFTMDGIWRVLRNPCYIGQCEINKSSRFKDQSALIESRRYRTTRALWPAILSEEEFNHVQKELDSNKFRLKATVRGHFDYIYSPLVFCSECNQPMVGSGGTGSNGKKYRYYGHKGKDIT